MSENTAQNGFHDDDVNDGSRELEDLHRWVIWQLRTIRTLYIKGEKKEDG